MTERAGLDVRLLGPIAAERNGETVALGGPRQRAVLARLALVPGQVVTVDRLVEDVWAGDPPPTAVNTLQSYVSLLRRALGDPRHVRREGPGYALGVDRAELDVARFEDRASTGSALLATDPAAALTHLDEALAEWRGPCLADVADEEWARAAAVRWDELRLNAVEARLDALVAMGRHGEAIAELERVTDEHPLREGFAGRLMVALYRAGRQGEALRVFSRTRQVLADELGLDPSPELAELRTAILNHDPVLLAAGPSPGDAPAPAGPPVTDAAAEAPSTASPVPLPVPATRARAATFVGRRIERAELGEMWSAAQAGTAQFALVAGEAGAGKSTLAADFAADCHERGAVVLWGRAANEAVVPFEPMVHALRGVLRSLSPEARERVAGNRSSLALLLPELEQLVPSVRPERRDPAVERYLLFETVAEVLTTESMVNPLLFVIDDIQWADALTIKLIEHVLRHERTGRVMVIGTARVPSDEPNLELDRCVIELQRDGLLRRIAVGGLQRDEVSELLRIHGHDDGAAAELHATTAGNAFFVTELIAHNDDSPAAELPDSIRTMMGVRLDRLEPVVNNVLAVAAVAGSAATLPVLMAAADLDADTLLDAADAAIAVGLLAEDGAGHLGFPHALVRQAVLARLGRTRRLDLHRRVGDALETAAGSEVPRAELARHLLAAGPLVDPARRLDAVIGAGREALAMVAYEDAAAWAEEGDALTDVQTDAGRMVELRLLHSDAARAVGERASAVAHARAACAEARTAGDPILLARAAEAWVSSISAVGFDFGQPADAELIEMLTEAIATVPTDETTHHVRLRSMLTSVLVETGDWERLERISAEALAIATRDGNARMMASAHLARRLALWRRDSLDERSLASTAAVAEARVAGDVHLELGALLFAMTDLMELGRIDDHLALLEQFQDVARGLRTPLYDVYAMFLRSCRLLVTGDYERAEEVANAALAAGLSAHGPNAEMAHSGQMFCLAWDRGQLGAALPLIEQMAEVNPLMTIWQIALAGSLVDAGRSDDARVVLERIVDVDSVHLPDDAMFFTACCFLVEVTRAIGDPLRAKVLQMALAPYADRIAVTGLGGVGLGPVSRYVGVAAHVAGDVDEACRLLTQAVADTERLGARPFEARARRDLARALGDRGGPGDAAESTSQSALAMALAGRLGMVLDRPL